MNEGDSVHAPIGTFHHRPRRAGAGRHGLRRHAATVHQPCGRGEPRRRESPAAESPAESAAPTEEAPSGEGRLADVQARGQLICGVNGALPGFSFLDEATGDYTGFDVDFCRALAAAVLGDPGAGRVPQRCHRPARSAAPVGRHRRPDPQHDVDRQSRHVMGPLRTDDVLRRPGHHGELDPDRRDGDRRPRRRDRLRPVRHDHRAEPHRPAGRLDHAAGHSRRSTPPTPPTRKAAATRSPATDRSSWRDARHSRILTIT